MWVAFSKNIRIYAIFNDQSFNDTLTNDIVSFEQLGPDLGICCPHMPEDTFSHDAATMNIVHIRTNYSLLGHRIIRNCRMYDKGGILNGLKKHALTAMTKSMTMLVILASAIFLFSFSSDG